MSYFFTDHFKAALTANQDIMNGAKVQLVLFRYAPAMGADNPAWRAADNMAELTAQTGWTQVTGIGGYPLTLQLDVGTRTVGGSRYVMFSDYPFTGLTEVAEVRAIGVVFVGTINGVVNPLIFVTNTPVGDVANIASDDALTANPDSTFPDATNRWLFGWGTTTPDPVEGPLVLSRGSPDFEVSGSQHAWLYPQRANMIANPSFEKPGTDFWSANTPISRVSVAREPAFLTPKVGTVTSPNGGALPVEATWIVKLRGPTTGEDAQTMFAQWEGTGASYILTRVITPNTASSLTWYGTGTLIFPQIFSPVPSGGIDTYAISLKQNDDATHSRMTTWVPEGAGWVEYWTGNFTPKFAANTSDGNIRIGAYHATPQGENVWNDRIYSVELRSGLNPAAGTVLWRFDAADYPGTGTSYIDPRGRTWTLTAAGAITPAADPSWAGSCAGAATGYATAFVKTPDSPDSTIAADCVITAKVNRTTIGTSNYETVCSTIGSDTAQYGWRFWFIAGGPLSWGYSLDGTTAVNDVVLVTYAQVQTLFNDNEDFYIGVKVHIGTPSVIQAITSTDGVLWTDIGAAATLPGTGIPKDVTAPLQVGGQAEYGQHQWQGRVYWVEMRTGLIPGQGALRWRFDANDYPGTGTSYADPRGRTWTMNAVGAITAKTGSIPGYAIMESNVFPTQMGELDSEQWTVQLMARGSGRLKVGFVFWDSDYRITATDWGDNETWILSPDTWNHVATHRFAPEGHIAMIRLELEGTGLTIDRVLAERGYLKDWLYFDGDEHYGARDDFSWYGGSNRQGASYSFWYNHRKAVTGRLFARTVDPNDPGANVTDEDMEEQGLVYRWVPAGISVIPHLDVLYPFDMQNPLPPKAAGVLGRVSVNNPDGVSDPWV